MIKTSNRIVFFGNERLATAVTTDLPVLRGLISNGYNVVAIITNQHESRSRSGRLQEIAEFAGRQNIPLHSPYRLSEIHDDLVALQADTGVLVAYGQLVPERIIDVFPNGIINLHPSLLPKHRGPTPIESAILQGDDTTGISIMRLAKEMDAGPVYAQSEVILSGEESKQQLAEELAEVGRATLLDVLPGIIEGSLVALPQDHTKATIDRRIDKKDAWLDYKRKTAQTLVREVRAYAGWPGSRATLGDIDVIVTAAHASADETSLSLPTPEGYLAIDRLKPSGKKEMSADEFLRGYGGRL